MAFASFDDKRAHAPMAEINMVPLIDVMLVLLVIFIVAAPLLTHNVQLQLPKAVAQVTAPSPTPVVQLAIDAHAVRYWNGQPVDRETLAARMRAEAAKPVQPELRLSADEAVPYRAVAETLAEASRAGLSKIGFVTDPAVPRPAAPAPTPAPAR